MLPTARIDTHQHFWQLRRRRVRLDRRLDAALRRDFLPDEALARDAAGRRSNAASPCRRGRASRRRAGCSRSPTRIRSSPASSAGSISRSPAVEADLDAVAAHPQLVGVRHIVQAEPDGFLASPGFRRGVGAARALRPDLRHPGLRAAAARGGGVRARASRAALRRSITWESPTSGRRLRRRGGGISRRWPHFRNVWCKLSGLVTEADWQSWTAEQLRPYLDARSSASVRRG